MPRKTTALAPWFGSNRTCAENVGAALKGCTHVVVPFGGGMCELMHIEASTINVSDVHRHIINLANVVKIPTQRERLIVELNKEPVHPDTLDEARQMCKKIERGDRLSYTCFEWAKQYFICAWMSRNGTAGTKNEFNAPMSVRW